jgi:hypothetical protein
MRDGGGSLEGWRWLGRLLPADIRERVFEPALGDLQRAWLTGGSRPASLPFGVYALGTYLGCVPGAVPLLFVRRGRLTRLGRTALWSATALALALAWITYVSGTYPGG